MLVFEEVSAKPPLTQLQFSAIMQTRVHEPRYGSHTLVLICFYAIFEFTQNLKKSLFEYIETFYNNVRTHSHCDYMSLFNTENYMRELCLYNLLSLINFSFLIVLFIDI